MLRLLVSLEGEIVRDLKPIMGYVHTGIEKSCEDKNYWKVIPFVERMDYISYYFQMQAFCGAVERLLELEIPERAKYLRVIHLELNRIHSHLVWLGTSALDLGAMSMFFYCFRERDRILDLFEMSSGQRMHTRYFQVGGVFEDIPVGFAEKVQGLLRRDALADRPVRGAADPQRDLPPAHQGDRDRRRASACWTSGVTGPLLRAAGEPWDLRKAEPDLSYADLEFSIPVGTVGDGWDRYRVRIQEMRESVRIIEQAHRGPARGAVDRRRPQGRAAAPPRALDLDGGADPPLQARHRGLPGPARRGLLRDRGAARASWAASSSPTAPRSPPGSTSATRRS